MRFVAVTSCPTGIAHTYMAAEALEQAAEAAGHEIHVETQGAAGTRPLDPAVIAAADAVVLGADVEVRDRHRFEGKPIVDVGVKRAISDAPGVIEQAVRAARAAGAPADTPVGTGVGAPAGPRPTGEVTADVGTGTRVRQWLMTGVSYMIPFVAAGGILIAAAFMLAQAVEGETGAVAVTKVPLATVSADFNPLDGLHWAALLFQIGAASFGFLVPALAGYIAFAIADR
ncbi:MAG: fructose system or component, partial [Actinomycetota bacterium]|nr:fructose system or component [Actinomycetota bacterium]